MQRQHLVTLAVLAFTPIGFSQRAAPAQSPQPLSATKSEVGPSSTGIKVASPAVAANYGKLPLSFEANQGQIDGRVKFCSHGAGYSLFLTDSAAVLRLSKPNLSNLEAIRDKTRKGMPLAFAKRHESVPVKTDMVRMEIAGAARNSRVVGDNQLPGKANYFIGRDSAKWHTNIPTYARVKYSGVYPGVDLVYYGNQQQLEYDFIVAPGASAKPVKLHFAGTSQLKLNAGGDLIVAAKDGEIAFRKPVVYQERFGRREPVAGQFTLLAKNTVGFKLGDYDHSRELVIDPVLGFSTFLSTSTEVALVGAPVIDEAGNIYLVGSDLFPYDPAPYSPTVGTLQTAGGCVAVLKLNPAGTAVDYISVFGGDARGTSLAVDTSGNAYITGEAGSASFPITPGVFQSVNHTSFGITAFVTKLDSNGGLVYSTFLGGNSKDQGNSILVDDSGEAYVAGGTSSTNFPVTSGTLPVTFTTTDAYNSIGFVTKLNATGSALVYSTLIGADGPASYGAAADTIALDKSGNVLVAGYTGPGFPVTAGVYQETYPTEYEGGGYVAKLNPTFSALTFATYSPSGDVAFDSAGNTYISGGTFASAPFSPPATPGAFQQTIHSSGSTGFVLKLNSSGTALVYCTYLGGSTQSYADGVAVDAAGDAYVTGTTYDDDFPITPDAYQKVNKAYGAVIPPDTTPVNSNAYLTVLNSTGSALIYSTYLGGGTSADQGDTGYDVTLDSLGNAYLTGTAGTPNFPVTPGAYLTTNTAGLYNFDSYLAKFVFNGETSTTLTSDANPQVAGSSVSFTAYVTSRANADIPGGKVRFFIDNAFVGDVALDDTGHAVYSTAALAPGSHAVIASYFGDAKDAASVGLLTETITGQTATPNFLPVPGTYRTSATVTIADATTGSVIHYTTDGSTPGVGSPAYSAPITLTATTTLKAIAVAAGQSQSSTASGTYSFVPGAHTTSVSLTSSLIEAAYGEPVTFTATVKTTDGTTATGTVTFLHGSDVIGKASLTNGVATLTTSTLSDGSHGITAEYSGSVTEGVSGSPTVVVVVSP
jgi:hypothetical protein